MASNEESDAVTVSKMESMLQKWSEILEAKMDQRLVEIKDEIKVMNAKLDGNIVEMNQGFAAVDERFIKSEAIMTATKEQIVLVEDNLNLRITSLKDEVSANIDRQIGEVELSFIMS